MSEMIFSVKYHLHHKIPAKDAGLARDAVFGLFLLLLFLCFSITVVEAEKSQDEEDELAAGPHLQLLVRMKDDTRRYILQRLETAARDRETTPPSFHAFIVELQNPRRKAFSKETRQSFDMLNDEEKRVIGELYDAFLVRLDEHHGHLRVDNLPREV
jgi:hypothetical protein